MNGVKDNEKVKNKKKGAEKMKLKKILTLALAAVLAGTALASCAAKGFDKDGAITVISREKGSGTRSAFIELFGVEVDKEDKTVETADITDKTNVMMTSVSQNANAIGYISLGSLNDSVKALKIDGAAATVENIENAEILEIIDHHRIGSLETMAPVYFRNEPVGCTATIIYSIYKEKGFEVPPQIAGLLCSAILSDTLMFRSPTCTMLDRAAAEALSAIAGIDCQSFGIEMFTAGSNLKDKTPEEIFYQDYKKFEFGDVTFGVGQINSMSGSELDELERRLRPYLEKSCREHGLSMMFFMLTNIIEESTRLMCYGESADMLVEDAFGRAPKAGTIWLKGVVSRKKQLIPAFIDAISKEAGGGV